MGLFDFSLGGNIRSKVLACYEKFATVVLFPFSFFCYLAMESSSAEECFGPVADDTFERDFELRADERPRTSETQIVIQDRVDQVKEQAIESFTTMQDLSTTPLIAGSTSRWSRFFNCFSWLKKGDQQIPLARAVRQNMDERVGLIRQERNELMKKDIASGADVVATSVAQSKTQKVPKSYFF